MSNVKQEIREKALAYAGKRLLELDPSIDLESRVCKHDLEEVVEAVLRDSEKYVIDYEAWMKHGIQKSSCGAIWFNF